MLHVKSMWNGDGRILTVTLEVVTAVINIMSAITLLL